MLIVTKKHFIRVSQRSFAKVSQQEIQQNVNKLRRDVDMFGLYTKYRKFEYEHPDLYFDKKTGEVKISEKQKEGKIRRDVSTVAEFLKINQDVEREHYAKNPDTDSNPKLFKAMLEKQVQQELEDSNVDYSKFNVLTKDYMRVDCGLLVCRKPIFLGMNERDRKYQVYDEKIQELYGNDPRKFMDEADDLNQMNEDVLKSNEYRQRTNLDNFPTHRITDQATGEVREYFGASKYFKNVDPMVKDPKSLHNAGLYSTYLLVQNKETKEWEFPTTEMFVGETFLRAKQNILSQIINEETMVLKYPNTYPSVATLRRLTPTEEKEQRNYDKKGVRTFYFVGLHWRGLPEFTLDKSKYRDYAWVPKLGFKDYMERDYFEVFAKACSDKW